MAALLEVSGSIPNTYMWVTTFSSSRGSETFFWLPTNVVCRYAHRQNTHTHYKKVNYLSDSNRKKHLLLTSWSKKKKKSSHQAQSPIIPAICSAQNFKVETAVFDSRFQSRKRKKILKHFSKQTEERKKIPDTETLCMLLEVWGWRNKAGFQESLP